MCNCIMHGKCFYHFHINMMVPSIQIINIEKKKEKKRGVTSLIIWGILGVLVTVFSILIICILEPTVNKMNIEGILLAAALFHMY